MTGDYRILVLYELSLTIGSYDRLNPLLIATLQKLLYHTGFPMGMLLFDSDTKKKYILKTVIGDYKVKSREGGEILLPDIVAGHSKVSDYPDWPDNVVYHDNYRRIFCIPIPGKGMILLFTPDERVSEDLLPDVFRPIMLNLSRAIDLCALNEKYIRQIEYDRDVAQKNNVRFRKALDTTPDYFILIDPEKKKVIDCNSSVLKNLGYDKEATLSLGIEKIIKVKSELWLEYFHQLTSKRNQVISFDSYMIRADGDVFPVSIHLSALEEEGEIVIIAGIRDITSRKLAERRLKWQASHDALTGLFNRSVFEERLYHALEDYRAGNAEYTIFYLDLDQFKVVNDICGHIAGDQLLQQITSSMKMGLPEKAVLARLGGDEFGVILKNFNLQAAILIGEKIHKAINGIRFQWNDQFYQIGVSIGVVPLNPDSLSSIDLLSTADMACYAAKEFGGNRIHVYQGDEEEYIKRHDEMKKVSEIKHALDHENFILFAQTILPLKYKKRHARYREVLLRMKTDDGKIIAPDLFLQSAIKYNLMLEIDRYVVYHSFSLIADKIKAGTVGNEVYFINLSGHSITDKTFSNYIGDCIETFALPTKHIGFEITENTAISQLNHAIAFIEEMKALDIQFSLDDFGTGLSSFAYLKNLPVDFIKIDGSFVQDMLNDRVDYAMVDSINKIGQVMNLEIVAEYVTSEKILKELKKMGIDYAQGYAIGRPEELKV